jgi:hypothetical protein
MRPIRHCADVGTIGVSVGPWRTMRHRASAPAYAGSTTDGPRATDSDGDNGVRNDTRDVEQLRGREYSSDLASPSSHLIAIVDIDYPVPVGHRDS